MTWLQLLYVVAGSAAVTGMGGGLALGIAVARYPRRTTRPAPNECGQTCALAALPRDLDVALTRRRRRRPAGTPPATSLTG